MKIDRTSLGTTIRAYYRQELESFPAIPADNNFHQDALAKFNAALAELKTDDSDLNTSSPLSHEQRETLFAWINLARDRNLESVGSIHQLLSAGKKELSEIFGAEASDSSVYYLIFFREVTARFLTRESIEVVLRTNKSSFGAIFGTGTNQPFDHYASRSTLLSVFAASFADAFNSPDLEVLKAIGLKDQKILDVGGGAGGLAMALSTLEERPAEYDLFDLAETIAELKDARKVFFDRSLMTRSLVPGNFFLPQLGNPEFTEAAQEKYDAIFMTWILHDWNDPQCDQILSGIKPLLKPNGMLYVIERPKDSAHHPFAAVYEFVMLALADGVERTLKEYDALLDRNGFERTDHRRVTGSRDFLCYRLT